MGTQERFSESAENFDNLGVLNLEPKNLAVESKIPISMHDFCSVQSLQSESD